MYKHSPLKQALGKMNIHLDDFNDREPSLNLSMRKGGNTFAT
jgi:hypothetical protein